MPSAGVRKIPSGRYQARYTGPDGHLHRAPVTFQTRGDAQAWLALRHTDILRAEWIPEEARRAERNLTFATYAEDWLQLRPLKPPELSLIHCEYALQQPRPQRHNVYCSRRLQRHAEDGGF